MVGGGHVRALVQAKGGKDRTVGLDPAAFALLERWSDHRQKLSLNGRQRFVCTLKGRPVQTAYVRGLLPRLAARAGIEKRVHPHGLRHTHAAELMREGVPVNVISRQLGHSSIATTARYLDHIQPQEVIEAMQRREWNP